MSKTYYITTTLPYVNSDPHLGFAWEIVQADTLARYQREILGKQVFFNTGTDEHGLKIFRSAADKNQTPQEYCDEYAAKFLQLKEALNLSVDNFIRTTDPNHKRAAQEFWGRCLANGDIYKGTYQAKYCVGCELEKTDTELTDDGHCPIHPNLKIELIEEENYFFKFSKYQKPLLQLYKQHPDLVVPSSRMNEIVSFVKQGLRDFSISRLKSKMPWGVSVPDDEDHVMYVWFDALVNYISALGWPDNSTQFNQFWLNEAGQSQAVQVAGKDNLRQQSAMWQAMLLSANVAPSRQILIHGFITSDGQKMSKSLGNVVNPFDLVQEFGADALRYFVLAELPNFADGDYTKDKFVHRYNSDLANGLGNLVSRIIKLASRVSIRPNNLDTLKFDPTVAQHLDAYQFNEALAHLWQTRIADLDKYINDQEPWGLQGEPLEQVMQHCVNELAGISLSLSPFLPETCARISQLLQEPNGYSKPLFPRV